MNKGVKIMQNTREMLIIKKEGKGCEPRYVTNINNVWYTVTFGRKINYTQKNNYQIIIVEEGTYTLKNWKPSPYSDIEKNYCDIYAINRIVDWSEKLDINDYNSNYALPF